LELLSLDECVAQTLALMDAKPPVLTCVQMDDIERRWNEQQALRRYALLLLTKPFSWLRAQVEADRSFALAVADAYRHPQETAFYQNVLDLMKEANYWMMMALCGRTDMSELLLEIDTRSNR
jgi:hypothetical protein